MGGLLHHVINAPLTEGLPDSSYPLLRLFNSEDYVSGTDIVDRIAGTVVRLGNSTAWVKTANGGLKGVDGAAQSVIGSWPAPDQAHVITFVTGYLTSTHSTIQFGTTGGVPAMALHLGGPVVYYNEAQLDGSNYIQVKKAPVIDPSDWPLKVCLMMHINKAGNTVTRYFYGRGSATSTDYYAADTPLTVVGSINSTWGELDPTAAFFIDGNAEFSLVGIMGTEKTPPATLLAVATKWMRNEPNKIYPGMSVLL